MPQAVESVLRALADMAEMAPDGLLVLDGEGQCLYANAAACALLDYAHEALLGQDVALAFSPREQQAIKWRLCTGDPGSWSSILRHSRGEESAIECRLQISQIEQRSVVTLSLRDVTHVRLLTRKAAAVAAIASSMAYAGTLEATLDALARSVAQITGVHACTVVLFDEAQQPRVASMYGLPEDLVLRLQGIWQAGVGARPPSLRAAEAGETIVLHDVPQALLSDPVYASVHEYLRTAPWKTMVAAPLMYRGRALGSLAVHYAGGVEPGESEVSFLSAIADQAAVAVENARLAAEAQEQAALDERRQAERALRASEARVRTMIEQAPYSIQVFAPDGTALQVNKAWEKLRGVTLDQIRGYNVLHDPQLEAKGLMPYIERGFAGEAIALPPVKYEPNETISGVTDVPHWWVRSFIYPVKDDAGRVREVVLVHEDITEQKETEAQLREQEEQYRSIFEATSDGLIIADSEGVVVEANPAVCRMYGYTYDELIGLRVSAITHPDHRHKLDAARPTIEQGGTFQAQAVGLRKDGSPLHAEVRGTTFVYRGRPHVLAVIRDVTERVEAYEMLEQRVEERTREFSTLLDVSHNVASTLELEPLLGLILDQLRTVMEYSGAALFLLDREDLLVLARRAPGPDPTAGPSGYAVERVRPLLDLLRPGEPIIIDDVRGDDPLAQTYRSSVGDYLDTAFSYERSWMAVPMMAKDRMMGVLTLSSSEPGYYTARHATLALAIANQAAMAIENARLYAQAQELAAVEERQRLARELHDSVTQALFSMTLQASASRILLKREGADPDGPLARSVRELTDLAQGALAEMRALIFELRPGALQEEGLVAAVRKHTAALSARAELDIVVHAPHDRVPLPSSAEEHLYRLVQEALHNVVKHAEAHQVVVRLEPGEDGTLALEILDDGVGFDVTIERPGHMGLMTMAERAHGLGGRLEIESRPGHGTAVRVEIPRVIVNS